MMKRAVATLFEEQKLAYGMVFDAAEAIRRVITYAKAEMQSLELPDEIVSKLIEGQQALFAAQQLMGKMFERQAAFEKANARFPLPLSGKC